MVGSVIDVTFSTLVNFGYPVLFVVFVLKGAIVGKPLPTSLFLPGYVLAVSATGSEIVLSILVAAIGYVCGQLLIYGVARQWGVDTVRSIRFVDLSEGQIRWAERFFHRYSGVGVFVTNLVPYVGSFVMIPAGLATYPAPRLTVYALVSTVLNYVLIVWVVVGAFGLIV